MAQPLAQSNVIVGDQIHIISGENIKKEVEFPEDNPELHECVVCVSSSLESYDIFTTKTSASETPVYAFLGEITKTELPFHQSVTKHICKSCLDLVNDLEQCEIEYIKLKSHFQSIIRKNPLFHLPQSVEMASKGEYKEGSEMNICDNEIMVRDPISGIDPNCSQPEINIKKEIIDEGDIGSCCETILVMEPMTDDSAKQKDTSEEVNETFIGRKTRAKSRARPQKTETKKTVKRRGKSQKNPKTQTGEKKHECSICKSRFKYKSLLLIHFRTHTGEKPYECSACDKKFVQKVHLTNHLITHGITPGEKLQAPFECNVCQKTFKRKHHLKEHLRIHSDEKPFKCNVCSYTVIRKHDFFNHLRTHTGEKPHECEVCHRRFNFRGTLREHLRTHTGEKPYACDVCPRRFSHLHVLKSHKRTHTDEKPFECDVCNQRFNQKSHLKSHMSIHTGEKPYECTYCSRRFCRRRALEEHIRTHTGEKPFECEVCHHKFAQKSNLHKHVRNHKHFKVQSDHLVLEDFLQQQQQDQFVLQ